VLEHLGPAILHVLDVAKNALPPAKEPLQPRFTLDERVPSPVLAIHHQQIKGEETRIGPSTPEPPEVRPAFLAVGTGLSVNDAIRQAPHGLSENSRPPRPAARTQMPSGAHHA